MKLIILMQSCIICHGLPYKKLNHILSLKIHLNANHPAVLKYTHMLLYFISTLFPELVKLAICL